MPSDRSESSTPSFSQNKTCLLFPIIHSQISLIPNDMISFLYNCLNICSSHCLRSAVITYNAVFLRHRSVRFGQHIHELLMILNNFFCKIVNWLFKSIIRPLSRSQFLHISHLIFRHSVFLR